MIKIPESIRDPDTSDVLGIDTNNAARTTLYYGGTVVGGSASAIKVYISNPLTPHTEAHLGANCDGNTGETDRVLKLANTALSFNEQITLNGQILIDTIDYTTDHESTTSNMTFLGEIYNDDNLSVRYFQQ